MIVNIASLNGIPTLIQRANAEYQIVEHGKNYYLDITLLDEFFSKNSIARESNPILEFVKGKIADMKEIATKEPNIFFIFNCSYLVSPDCVYDEGETPIQYNIYERKYSYRTTKEKFDSKIYNDIIKAWRDYPDENIEMYCYGNVFAEFMYDYDFKSEFLTYIYDTSIGDIWFQPDEEYNNSYDEDYSYE